MSNSTNVVPFDFEGNDVLVVEIDGEAWFVAKDLANILGYSATSAMNKHIDEEDRQITMFQNGTIDVKQSLTNESGVYAAIFGSKKPQAKRFKKWVTSEVLPSIRKTGSYQVPLTREQRIAAVLLESQELIEEQNVIIQEQTKQIEEYRPKVEFTDNYCDADGLRGFRDVCNLLKANEREFRDFLVARGYMYQKGKGWAAYKKHITNGLFKMVEGHNHKANINYTTPMFTPRGVVKLSQEWHRFVLFGL